MGLVVRVRRHAGARWSQRGEPLAATDGCGGGSCGCVFFTTEDTEGHGGTQGVGGAIFNHE